MSRTERIHITLGLLTILLGLTVAIGAQFVVGYWAVRDFPPALLIEQSLPDVMSEMQRHQAVANYFALGGLALAGCGFLYVLAVLARWFIGPAPAPAGETNVPGTSGI